MANLDVSVSDRQKDYHQYLLSRSILGHSYRKFFLYPRIAKHLPGKAIDVGCGIGDFLGFRNNTVGIDVNEHSVNYCKERGFSSFLIERKRFPFDEGTFDSCLIDNVLEHIVEPDETLREINRVLNDNGVLVIGVPGLKGYSKDPDHKVFYNEYNLKSLLTEYGYVLKTWMYTPFKSDYLDRNLSLYCLYGVFQRI